MAGASTTRQLQHPAKERGQRLPECTLLADTAGMDHGEFWNYVLLGILPGEERFDDGPWDDGPPEITYTPLNPCVVCGSIDACGYDDEGRPMIHATENDDD